jgi:hypothetical protein
MQAATVSAEEAIDLVFIETSLRLYGEIAIGNRLHYFDWALGAKQSASQGE